MPLPPADSPAPVLALRKVDKAFGAGAERLEVLAGIDFELAEGEIVAIVGFSGSGKTTLLSLMAGLLAPDAGEVLLDGALAGEPGPERGVVFQSYALLPWLTALANVQLGVDAAHRDWPRRERRAEAERFVRLVGLEAAAKRRPGELSGGMRQRVALARALAMSPRILLLDEPLGALDALTRATLQGELARIFAASKKSVVLVTNDVDEALLLADRVVPLGLGPRASLGPAFPVMLARPRRRAALNHDPAFVKLRNEITAHLLALRASRADHARKPIPPLPALEPRR